MSVAPVPVQTLKATQTDGFTQRPVSRQSVSMMRTFNRRTVEPHGVLAGLTSLDNAAAHSWFYARYMAALDDAKAYQALAANVVHSYLTSFYELGTPTARQIVEPYRNDPRDMLSASGRTSLSAALWACYWTSAPGSKYLFSLANSAQFCPLTIRDHRGCGALILRECACILSALKTVRVARQIDGQVRHFAF